MIAVLPQVPSKTKMQMKEVQVACQDMEGKYRGVCQDTVYISASSADEQHQFGITHFLVLSLITFLKFVPWVNGCVSSLNWDLLPFDSVLNLKCNVKSLLLILTKASFICLQNLISMNLWLLPYIVMYSSNRSTARATRSAPSSHHQGFRVLSAFQFSEIYKTRSLKRFTLTGNCCSHDWNLLWISSKSVSWICLYWFAQVHWLA